MMTMTLNEEIGELWDKKTEIEKEELRKAMNNKKAGKKEYVEGIMREMKRRAFIKKEEKIIKKLEEELKKLNKELKDDGNI